MTKVKSARIILALLIIMTMLTGLCSCKSKSEEESTTEAEITSVDVSVTETESTAATTQPEQTTAKPEITTAVPAQAQTQAPAVTEAPELTGTQTITDGNKTVVYPLAVTNSSRSFPVIVWANGTGCPTQTYMGLLEALANGGYIVVADSSVMTADGTAQIDSVNYILNKKADSSSVFYNRVDTAAIGACGHSQGGRSSVNAAQKDSRIRCIVSIAGASSADEARGLGIPCLFLTGTNDLVVISSQWCKPSYDAVAGRAAYASLKGGIHTTCMTNPEKVAPYALDWFNAYIKNDAQAMQVFTDGGKLATDGAWQDFQNKN